MADQIKIIMGPPDGYHELGQGMTPLLACNACGALIVETTVHDRWHVAMISLATQPR